MSSESPAQQRAVSPAIFLGPHSFAIYRVRASTAFFMAALEKEIRGAARTCELCQETFEYFWPLCGRFPLFSSKIAITVPSRSIQICVLRVVEKYSLAIRMSTKCLLSSNSLSFHRIALVRRRNMDFATIEADLRTAVSEDQFELRFQPIVTLATRKITDVEVFVRWQHPTFGNIPPVEFLPILEKIGLISTVDDWVLIEACQQLKLWSESIPQRDNLNLTVNVSASQFIRPNFASRVAGIIGELYIDPRRIQLDVAETIIVADLNLSRHVCMALKDVGVRVAIDDFGTGHERMAYLSELPVNTLKIDRTITEQLGEDASAGRIVRSMIETAHNLGLTVTGVGIETREQLQQLQNFWCDSGQGYRFDWPLSADEMTLRLRIDALPGTPGII